MTQDKPLNILITNDDGPLDDYVSQYIRPFVQYIKNYRKNWNVTLCVPSSQKSWIGKAHFAGKNLEAGFLYSNNKSSSNKDFIGPFTKPLVNNTSTKFNAAIPDFNFPYTHPVSKLVFETYADLIAYYNVEWCTVDGTPASCTDIGLHHISNSASPFDLVISGPNVGRNCSRPYITSSGTVGAAFESCITGNTKSIALSWAYFDGVKDLDEDVYYKAAALSCDVIESLYHQWGVGSGRNVELYSINVPIFQELDENSTKAVFAPLLDNKWSSLFHGNETESAVVFKWDPQFDENRTQMVQSLANGEINDGSIVENRQIAITPLIASFKEAIGENNIGETFEYTQAKCVEETGISPDNNNNNNTSTAFSKLCMSIGENEYIYQPIVKSMQQYLPNVSIINTLPANFIESSSSEDKTKVFQYADYEDIDHEYLNSVGSKNRYFANTYTYRKSLIRKHYLNNTIKMFCSKNPESILNKAFLDSYHLELDYAEFLDDSLDENWELRQDLEEEEDDKWWIVKPSMSDKGQGIRVFKTIDDLQAIFDSFDEGVETDDEDNEHQNDADDENKIIISQLRHFIVQRYLVNPLLLPEMNNKKFHIRCYVFCNGDLEVQVYDRMLALFAPTEYNKPAEISSENLLENLECHLTNTCLQKDKENSVREFDLLTDITADLKTTVKSQIHEIVKDLFKAASNDRMNFQAVSNSFEIFGLDFLVDDNYNVKLLECNSYPDFKQTGDDLKDLIDELFNGVVKQGICPRLAPSMACEETPKNFTSVYKNISNNW